jgi:hypothetical protein
MFIIRKINWRFILYTIMEFIYIQEIRTFGFYWIYESNEYILKPEIDLKHKWT